VNIVLFLGVPVFLLGKEKEKPFFCTQKFSRVILRFRNTLRLMLLYSWVLLRFKNTNGMALP
jgi:hypothetical protein